jgi:hypothetical protein
MSEKAEREIRDGAWRKAVLLAAGMVAAPVLYVIVGLAFLRSRPGRTLIESSESVKDAIFFVSAALSTLSVLLAAVVRRLVLSDGYVLRHSKSMGQAAQHYLSAVLITLSLCEVPAVTGLVCCLLTGRFDRLVMLAAASAVVTILLFPGRARLETLIRLTRQEREAKI